MHIKPKPCLVRPSPGCSLSICPGHRRHSFWRSQQKSIMAFASSCDLDPQEDFILCIQKGLYCSPLVCANFSHTRTPQSSHAKLLSILIKARLYVWLETNSQTIGASMAFWQPSCVDIQFSFIPKDQDRLLLFPESFQFNIQSLTSLACVSSTFTLLFLKLL